MGHCNKRSRDWSTILHAKISQDSVDICSLIQIDNLGSAISGSLNSKNVMELTQIYNVEVFSKILFEVQNAELILGCDYYIINIDENKKNDGTLFISEGIEILIYRYLYESKFQHDII